MHTIVLMVKSLPHGGIRPMSSMFMRTVGLGHENVRKNLRKAGLSPPYERPLL